MKMPMLPANELLRTLFEIALTCVEDEMEVVPTCKLFEAAIPSDTPSEVLVAAAILFAVRVLEKQCPEF